MKSILAAFLLMPTLLSYGEISNSRLVSIQADLETARDDAKRERTETVGYKLDLNLRAASSVTGELEVVTIIFAKKLPGGGTVERKSGRKITLDPNHQATFKSPTEKFTHTREHEVRVKTKKKKGQKKAPVRYKDVPASGEKYSGWAVRVYKGKELIGEEASASYLKLDD